MEKYILEMLEAYIRGSLAEEEKYPSDYMKGYFAGIKGVHKHLQFEKEIYGLVPSDTFKKVEA